ncbi:haloacid dehalogenase [Leptolinea tardivitalis]|uniref:Haloacid dehalogenase n=2 Tax=Leptolinea tardivitalis TaxID=229920 RepID=A0A0P6X2E0_9CHLR|nr:haloacid dehalogenase [Leptolinea tardivitalis]
MQALESISERSHKDFDTRTKVRDQALAQARQLTRHAAHTIRAIHRGEAENAEQELSQARELVEALKRDLAGYPDLFYAGYTQDAIKEFTEASITVALILNKDLPSPEDLEVETSTYWNGLAEAVGELRRRCLDILRQGYSDEAERLLSCMDEIYTNLVTMDYPDAVTQGLRRQTDLVRSIVEKTRGDLTLSLRFQLMEHALIEYTQRVNEAE